MHSKPGSAATCKDADTALAAAAPKPGASATWRTFCFRALSRKTYSDGDSLRWKRENDKLPRSVLPLPLLNAQRYATLEQSST